MIAFKRQGSGKQAKLLVRHILAGEAGEAVAWPGSKKQRRSSETDAASPYQGPYAVEQEQQQQGKQQKGVPGAGAQPRGEELSGCRIEGAVRLYGTPTVARSRLAKVPASCILQSSGTFCIAPLCSVLPTRLVRCCRGSYCSVLGG